MDVVIGHLRLMIGEADDGQDRVCKRNDPCIVSTCIQRRPALDASRLCQIGELAVATFITLLLVPVFYSIFVLDIKWETTEREQATVEGEPAGADPHPAS